MNTIMIISKTDMATNWGYYSQILTLMTILERIKKSLILVIILLSQDIIVIQTH